jgi:methyltransferase-like protein/SAM-dependent methyltransferase
MSEQTPANSYDEVPYSSFPYPRTHPDRLATIAGMFGLQAPPIAAARVLELGCASGGNVIPMAEQLPGAQFVGVDLSEGQIATGMAAVVELQLPNVQLRHADILDIDEDYGEFDYVICHGVFSWVPPAVQDKILDICRTRLRENGVGFISYNTYPGWHLRESVREMMRYHVRQFEEPSRRVDQARALVDFLANAVVDDSNPHSLLLRRELQLLSQTGNDYLFHEHLEEHNAPCYFHQFAERLAGAQLQYLAEADAHTMLHRELPAEVAQTIGRISPDIVSLEQYTDFIRNRQFRQTLVCHADVPLHRSLGPEVVSTRYVAFGGKPAAGPIDLAAGAAVAFEAANELVLTSSRSVTKAALVALGQRWPAAVPFPEVWEATRGLLSQGNLIVPDEEATKRDLAADLLECYFRGGIELRTAAPSFAREVGERPSVSAYARWQARHAAFATNRRHERVALDPAAVHIVQLLDGTRDRAAIVDALVQLVADGTLNLSRDDERMADEADVRDALGQILDEILQRLLGHAVLV